MSTVAQTCVDSPDRPEPPSSSPSRAAASCTGGNLTYDTAGRTATHAGWAFAYDSQGRMTSACKSSTCASGFEVVEFAYDGESHRTQLKTTSAAGTVATRDVRYQGDAIVEEKLTDPTHAGVVVRSYITDDAGATVKLVIPAGEPDPGIYLVTWSGHGDALALWHQNADGTTTLANSFTYDTWGKPTTATHNGIADLGFRFTYVGEFDVQWDDAFGLGLLYMHARHYSPALGRFLQPDPTGTDPNAFGYAGNGPPTSVDPSGETWCAALLALAAVGGSGVAGAAVCWGLTGLIALALVSPAQAISRAVAREVENAIRRGNRSPRKCVVIGENQTRVITRARIYGCEVMPRVRVALGSSLVNRDAIFMKANRAWIAKVMNEGRVIVDIGPDFAQRRSRIRQSVSPDYEMEYNATRGYPGLVRLWDEPSMGLNSYLPRQYGH